MASTGRVNKRRRGKSAEDFSSEEEEEEQMSDMLSLDDDSDVDIRELEQEQSRAAAALAKKPGVSEAQYKRRIASLEAEVEALKAEVKRLKGDKVARAGGQAPMDAQQLAKVAEKTRSNMVKMIKSIMVYKRSAGKYGKCRINLTVPSVPEQVLKVILGEALYADLAKKKKSGMIKIVGDDLERVLGDRPYTSLRYGGMLSIHQDELNFKYQREDSSLTLTGFYSMGC